jgi:23S rRNA (cytosine1962-C5)-methyltransferase
MKRVILKRGEERRIRAGHCWVFSNEIENIRDPFAPGEPVDVSTSGGRFIGRGYINPHSLIAVRLLTRAREEVDSQFFRRRIQAALGYRRALYPGDRTYRVVYSESDGLAGLIVDKYEDYLAVQTLTLGMNRHLELIVEVLAELLAPRGIVLRNDTSAAELEGMPPEQRIIHGDITGVVRIEQDGVLFDVDPLTGQKTGFYLDQRDNRQRLEKLVRGSEVLDCFCYTGAWSLYAARYGARRVLGIETSAHAISQAQANARLNGSDVCEFQKADTLPRLKQLARSRTQFDCVVLDPPAFAKSKKHLRQALAGYLTVNRHAMRVVRPGGYLVTSCCSHHVDRESFMALLRKGAAQAGRRTYVVEFGGQSRDHPVLLAVPETEYLKCYILRML